ncbi:tripartite motif-containing protein 66 isoform X3 [Electrophorus electricus]|uniref:tripartite motif-containing protein 66 isoform X3 n=1 Tax=Electrophorus electricus TaxID=8005 RepID=UPI0015CFC74F|nr:tripartite motif-containing protein 66 isoform X3 [Electrophorus electricus]
MEKFCSECSETRVGHSLCTHCNKWLCFPCTDLHLHERTCTQPSEHQQHQQRASSPSALPETGPLCCEHAVVMCPLHKQETLELLCETCDLMTCSICHLSSHKDHRLVHVGQALQDQRWLLENLMARVEEKRTAVENTAKQIQGRLHGVKITQRKAENQIKMAKMIMMNELNKRSNLLIEQLESVSSSFKQHLEDQLQGAIELCSQLEHVQNFITWAVAHHRRNPLLFSKDLIALQMQQLLEPLQYSETWAPLKVKFNWDAGFWTQQISTLGQLSVEGGSCPYSEGPSRILRPQPLSCRAVSSLCHPARDADCGYQAFRQPRLCCLHCRAAQSVPLDKYPLQCPQQADCSSPAAIQRCWEPEGSAMPPQAMVPPQRSSGPEQVRRSPSRAELRQQAAPPPQPRQELLHPAPDRVAAKSAKQPTSKEPAPAMENETLQQRQQQLDEPPGQCSVGSSAGSSPLPAPELSFHTAWQDGDVTSPCSDMHAPVRADVRSPTCPEERPTAHGRLKPARRTRTSLCDGRPAGAGDQQHTPPQDCVRPRAGRPVVPVHTQTHPPATLTTYKTEPDNVYGYTDNTGCKSGTKSRRLREAQDTSREVNEASKVPVVCLERLSIPVSKQPTQGVQSDDLSSDSGLKAEGTVSLSMDRELPPEGVGSEEVEESLHLQLQVPADAPQGPAEGQGSSGREGLSALDTPPAPASEASPHTDSEREPASHCGPSGPVSDSLLESATEADLASELEVESELQTESEPSLESEPRINSDTELESEQLPESELLAESERDLASDLDSAAEVSLNLELPEVRAGPSVAAPPLEEEPAEMENEDFCAVCLIGGDLLCCDRCPKVFHLACHVPSLLSFPTGDWVCTLCRDAEWPEVEYDSEDARLPTDTAPSGLSACDQRKCEKLTLLIYSNILSAPFHEPVSPLARHYYQIIRRPMDLSVIRSKLHRGSSSHYSSPSEFAADVLLMFKNCAKFNYPDSEVAQAGRSLHAFFSTKLGEVLPELSCLTPQDDSDSEENEEAEQAAVAGFPWPERREQSHRKRKRRHSLSWRRHHY